MWSMLDPHSEAPYTVRMGKESWDNAATCCLENMSEPPAGAAAERAPAADVNSLCCELRGLVAAQASPGASQSVGLRRV